MNKSALTTSPLSSVTESTKPVSVFSAVPTTFPSVLTTPPASE